MTGEAAKCTVEQHYHYSTSFTANLCAFIFASLLVCWFNFYLSITLTRAAIVLKGRAEPVTEPGLLPILLALMLGDFTWLASIITKTAERTSGIVDPTPSKRSSS